LSRQARGYSVLAEGGRATRSCAQCGTEIEGSFRFCPWCAAPQRLKLTDFFAAHERDRGKALRVSRYLGEERHVRFSVWNEEGVAEAAVSLGEDEASRLARFLAQPRRPRRRGSRTSPSPSARTFAETAKTVIASVATSISHTRDDVHPS
jgi:hypothetical protein